MRLLDLVSKYIRMLKREKLHLPRTIKSYESDLKLFSGFVGGSHAIYDISEPMIERYFTNLSEIRKMSTTTLSRKASAIRGFFRYLEHEDLILRSPMDRLAIKIKPFRKKPVFITPDEISRFFHVIHLEHKELQQHLVCRRERGDKDLLLSYQLFCNTRNNLLFRVLLETGIRIGELTTISHDSVLLSQKSGSFMPGNHTNRDFSITNPETLRLLKRYQNQVKYFKYQTQFFFFNRNMGPLSTVMVQKIFQNYLKQTGIKRQLTPSSLRHAFAVNLIKQNKNINAIRGILGYKTFEGLSIYQDYFDSSSGSTGDKK